MFLKLYGVGQCFDIVKSGFHLDLFLFIAHLFFGSSSKSSSSPVVACVGFRQVWYLLQSSTDGFGQWILTKSCRSVLCLYVCP